MVGPRTCHNLSLTSKDKFAEYIPGATNEDNNIPISISAIFWAPIPAFTLAFASALIPLGRYIDEDLKRATKLALELFVWRQKHGQFQANSAF